MFCSLRIFRRIGPTFLYKSCCLPFHRDPSTFSSHFPDSLACSLSMLSLYDLFNLETKMCFLRCFLTKFWHCMWVVFYFYRKAIPANNARNVTMVTLVTLSSQEAAVNHALATTTSTNQKLETVTGWLAGASPVCLIPLASAVSVVSQVTMATLSSGTVQVKGEFNTSQQSPTHSIVFSRSG